TNTQTETAFLARDGLQGARIGVLMDFFGSETVHQQVNAVTETAIRAMTEAGATMIRIKIPNLEDLTRDIQVPHYESKIAFNNYLARLGARAPVKSLGEFIARGEFPRLLRPELDADQQAVDGLNDSANHNRQPRAN